MLKFDHATRKAIFGYYAKQFQKNDAFLDQLAAASNGLSSRELKEICEHAERKLAGRIVLKESDRKKDKTPSLSDYLASIKLRQVGTNQSQNDYSL
jgi:hypothetical protein